MSELKSFAKEIKAVYEVKNNVRRVKVNNSEDVVEHVRKVWPVDITYREAFVCVYLNQQNNTIGHTIISLGGITGTMVDVRMVFQHALVSNATRMILAHNHPSGSLKPSSEDIKLTNKIKEASKLLDIYLLDHVILTENSFYSFADNSIL